ncbi:MAG: vegetative protein [Myxococcota bacterium]
MATEKKCKVEGCKRPYQAKGYCVTHYKKWKAGEMPKARFRRCFETECKKKEFGRGLCEEHYYAKFGGKKPEAPAAV